MTENQFFNILTDIRSEQLNVYVLGVDPAISEKDFSAQVNVFKKYFDQEFDPKTSPKCPTHNYKTRTYRCPKCTYTEDID